MPDPGAGQLKLRSRQTEAPSYGHSRRGDYGLLGWAAEARGSNDKQMWGA